MKNVLYGSSVTMNDMGCNSYNESGETVPLNLLDLNTKTTLNLLGTASCRLVKETINTLLQNHLP